jgi:hypothetical protein
MNRFLKNLSLVGPTLRGRKPRLAGFCLVAGVLALGPAPGQVLAQSATSTNTTGRPAFSSFKLITDRNIFSPRRTARSSGVRETQRMVRTENLSLVGTMSYEKGLFAFFEGSRSDYRKVVKPSEDIAGFTVAQISRDCVRLTQGTNELKLPVGSFMRKEEGGEWQLAAGMGGSTGNSAPGRSGRTGTFIEMELTNSISGAESEPQVVVIDSATQTIATIPEADSGTNGVAEAGSSGSDDPVLRRLMQRREQELNR